MAVNFTLGFEDEYSREFEKLSAAMEEQEKASEQLRAEVSEHTEALKRMAKEHEDATRAMLKTKEASGSLSVGVSRATTDLNKSSRELENAAKQTSAATRALAGIEAARAITEVTRQVIEFAKAMEDRGIPSLQGFSEGMTELEDAGSTALAQLVEFDPVTKWLKDSFVDAKDGAVDLGNTFREIPVDIQTGWNEAIASVNEYLGLSSEAERNEIARLQNERIEIRKQNEELREQQEIIISNRIAAQGRAIIEQQRADEAQRNRINEIRDTDTIKNKLREQEAILESIDENNEGIVNGVKVRFKTTEDLVPILKEIQLLEQRQKEIVQERAAEMRQIEADRKLQFEEEKKRIAEESRLREEAREKERRLGELIEDERRATQLQDERQFLELQKKRIEGKEGAEQNILELERESARRRHEIIMEGARTEEEVIRAKYNLERELRQIEFNHLMQSETKKVEVAQKVSDAAVKAEQDKLNKIRALRDEEGRNAFENIMSKQSPQLVEEEINRRRIAESRADRPNRGREAQRRIERGIRAQTARDLQSGNITKEQIEKVQSELASKQILAANKAGKVSQEVFQTLSEQVKAFVEQAKFNAEMAEQTAEIQIFMKQVQGGTKEQTDRSRAQRRAVRR